MSKGESSGKRKTARAGKNCERASRPAMDYTSEEQVRNEANRRWPDKEQEQKYFELNTAKKQRGAPAKRVKPAQLGFALLESLPTEQLRILLIASSLSLKAVKRYPGWVLARTYNLKNRPIQII